MTITPKRREKMRKLYFMLLVILPTLVTMVTLQGEVAAKEPITLKVAHQWPQNPEDPLIATALKYTDAITKKTNGEIKFQYYPAQSLIKANAAFQGMQKGFVDMSIFPYGYAPGIVPHLKYSAWEFVFEDDDAYFAWRKSKGYDLMEKKVNEAGVKTLVWLHYAATAASRGKFLATPADAKGLSARGGGVYRDLALRMAGAGLTPMVSAEIYSAAQRGMLEAVITSPSSMAAFKLYEVFDHYLAPTARAFDYGMEPICISMKTWNTKLNNGQRKVFLDLISESEEFGLAKIKEHERKVVKIFKDAGCKVREMTKDEFAQWKKLAREKVWPVMKKESPDSEFMFNTVPIE
jgi:TRAP-type C4-dicarboxylate transport system substrate-binding protein